MPSNNQNKLPLIMGILNITPDSFTDGGDFLSVNRAVDHAKKMLSDGASIIDVGAESTRPSAEKVSADEEVRRLLPVLEAINDIQSDALISVDTYKPEVAKLALEKGAKIINDVYSISDKNTYPMAEVAAEYGSYLVITDNSRNSILDKNNFLLEIRENLFSKIDSARKVGVEESKIIRDVGIGFGKTTEQNFALIANLDMFKELNCKLMLGVSRKSMFAEIVGDNLSERDDATAVISAISAYLKNVDILRVHDVKKTFNAIKISSNLKKWTK